MEEFVTSYPAIVLAIICLLFSAFGTAVTVIGWLIRQSVLKLNTTMEMIVKSVASHDIRLTAQETTCQLCRKSCKQATP